MFARTVSVPEPYRETLHNSLRTIGRHSCDSLYTLPDYCVLGEYRIRYCEITGDRFISIGMLRALVHLT